MSLNLPLDDNAPHSRFRPTRRMGIRLGIHGPAGAGKTTFARRAPKPCVFFDLDGTLDLVEDEDNLVYQYENNTPTARETLTALSDLRLFAENNIKTIVIDPITRLEQLTVDEIVSTVPVDTKGTRANYLEDYGWGKGYRYVYDYFEKYLAALNTHARMGRYVVLVAHTTTATVDNTGGSNYLRSEPRLLNPEKANTRAMFVEWCDHLLFIGKEVTVQERDKKALDSKRMIWSTEQPFCIAKNREAPLEALYELDQIDRMYTYLFGVK